MIVQALTRSWGVLPERHAGNTVWAVMDAARLPSPECSWVSRWRVRPDTRPGGR